MVNGPSHLKLNRGIAGFTNRSKILADGFEKLAANLVIDGKLRFESQLSSERHRAGSRHPNIRRTEDELVNRDQSWTDVIFGLGLLKMTLSQLLGLQNFAECNEQTVLLQLSVTQKYLARAGARLRIGR